VLSKIKSILGIFLRGMFGSWRGALGAALIALSIYLFIGFFTGTANIRNYIKNMAALRRADAIIEDKQKKLDETNLHIKLLQEYSPDFVSEMALRHLNIGDPELFMIKK
jgi:hypothetical protein